MVADAAARREIGGERMVEMARTEEDPFPGYLVVRAGEARWVEGENEFFLFLFLSCGEFSSGEKERKSGIEEMYRKVLYFTDIYICNSNELK